MYTSIISVAALVASLSGEAAAAAVKKPSFALSTQASSEARFNGLYVAPVHSGAGQNVVEVVHERPSSNATGLEIINGTYVGFPAYSEDETYYYYLSLTNGTFESNNNGTLSPATPKGYYAIAINIGQADTPGFKVSKKGLLQYRGERLADEFAAFAVCETNNTYPLFGPAKQLLWRSAEAVVPKGKKAQCDDVELKVTYLA